MTMSSLDIVTAIEEWVDDAIPDVAQFDFPPEELTENLPVVIAEISTDEQLNAEANLPGVGQYQQTLVRAWTVDIIILTNPDPPQDATHELYGYLDTLSGLLRKWVRLGPNVVLSQFYSASYDPPEVEFADGTKARQVTVRVTVGETIGA